MLPQFFVIIGTIIGSVAGLGYLLDTIKGSIKPNKVSFLLWSINPLIVFLAEMNARVGLSSIMVLSQGIIPLLIFVASFVNKKSYWKLTAFDIWCGVLSFFGIILWQITKEGNLAIMLSILADAFAAIPTIRKAYTHPETEVAWPWVLVSIGTLLTLLTLPSFTITNAGFLIYLIICNGIIFTFVQFKIGKRSKPLSQQ